MTEEELWSIAEHVEPDVLSDLATQLSFGTADFLQDGGYLHAGMNLCDAHLCGERIDQKSSEQKGTYRNSEPCEIGQNSSCKELL